jgi:hypothetical protein
MGDGVVDELVALFVFLCIEDWDDKGKKKEIKGRTSAETSRLR